METKVALNVRNIPLKLRRQYKAACDLKGITMKDDLLNYMAGCAETITVQAPKKDKHGQ